MCLLKKCEKDRQVIHKTQKQKTKPNKKTSSRTNPVETFWYLSLTPFLLIFLKVEVLLYKYVCVLTF